MWLLCRLESPLLWLRADPEMEYLAEINIHQHVQMWFRHLANKIGNLERPFLKEFYSVVSQVLRSVDTINLSEAIPDKKVLSYLLSGNDSVRNLTINCIRLNDSATYIFALPHLKELVLQKCSNFSHRPFVALGQLCSTLRLLSVELIYHRTVWDPSKLQIKSQKTI